MPMSILCSYVGRLRLILDIGRDVGNYIFQSWLQQLSPVVTGWDF